MRENSKTSQRNKKTSNLYCFFFLRLSPSEGGEVRRRSLLFEEENSEGRSRRRCCGDSTAPASTPRTNDGDSSSEYQSEEREMEWRGRGRGEKKGCKGEKSETYFQYDFQLSSIEPLPIPPHLSSSQSSTLPYRPNREEQLSKRE